MTKYSHEENATSIAATSIMQMQHVIETIAEEQFQDT